jgi:hypothetical protein
MLEKILIIYYISMIWWDKNWLTKVFRVIQIINKHWLNQFTKDQINYVWSSMRNLLWKIIDIVLLLVIIEHCKV